jgi:hypothetical protein
MTLAEQAEPAEKKKINAENVNISTKWPVIAAPAKAAA